MLKGKGNFIKNMRKCEICGKTYTVKTVRKKLRGKYNPTSKQRKYPNLQWVRLPSGKRVKACTKCIKTLSKTK
ncbi:MAG: L28 family ribosomal protein [Candidatus Pacebacteria bacterium]|nr:L28 family ribosomal protein [Candidatus Paceibacterota bacterium]